MRRMVDVKVKQSRIYFTFLTLKDDFLVAAKHGPKAALDTIVP